MSDSKRPPSRPSTTGKSAGKSPQKPERSAARTWVKRGFLVLASNSTKLSSADLDRALGEGAASVRAELRIVERPGLPPDFPVAPGFPEGNYLKLAIAVRVP